MYCLYDKGMKRHEESPMDAKEKQNVSSVDENRLPPGMLSTAEVARFLGVHVCTVGDGASVVC